MRIIDKQHDFYDYLQDPTDTIVFDRRGSFLLTKEMIINKIVDKRIDYRFYIRDPKKYLILQCGATYWHIRLELNDDDSDYNLELIDKFKDYNKQRTIIEIYNYYSTYYFLTNRHIGSSNFTNSIAKGYFNKGNIISCNINPTENDSKNENSRSVPILKACGISNIIDPVDIFTAIEEHFSLLKTEAERIEPIGSTNNDKIIMHGFDTKTSFRGKNK